MEPSSGPEALDRNIALYRRAVQVADIAQIVEARMVRNKGDTTIVPEREATDHSIVVIYELRLKTVLKQFRQNFVQLCFFIALNGDRVLGDRFTSHLRIGADDGMGHGGHHL